MTWIASTNAERRTQLGQFLLGTGNIGGIGLATGPGIGLSPEEGLQLIERAAGAGFKVFDTADAYTGGTSQLVVGTWNKAHPDRTVLTQTKTGVTDKGPNLTPERIRRQLAQSTAVLGHVDLYLAHVVDPETPWEKSLPVFHDAIEDGTISAYGLSNVDAPQLAAALDAADRLRIHRPEIIQNSYSLLDRSDDHEVLPLVHAEGLAYTPYSPLAKGLLAGRYSNGEVPAPGSRAGATGQTNAYLSNPEVMATIRRFDDLAKDLRISPAGLALGWLINHAVVTAPVVAFSRESHWTGVDEARELHWTPAVSRELDEMFPAR